MPNDTSDRAKAVVENAARLLSDAKLLLDNGRTASAFALAVLGVEEIGKIILTLWNASAPLPARMSQNSSHRRKQAAVAALLLGVKVIQEVADSAIDDPISEELVGRVARALHSSEHGWFSAAVAMGALDKTKQLALYRDEWFEAAGLHPEQFDQTDVLSLFDKARAAMAVLSDAKHMRVGRAIYIASMAKT